MANEIDVVFFDIGDTLLRRNPVTGAWEASPDSGDMLRQVREVLGLRVGIITTLGSLDNAAARQLLEDAGLWRYVDVDGLISEHDALVRKPAPGIYRFAANRLGVPIGRCLFVGEDLVEVLGALSAGMKAVLKRTEPAAALF